MAPIPCKQRHFKLIVLCVLIQVTCFVSAQNGYFREQYGPYGQRDPYYKDPFYNSYPDPQYPQILNPGDRDYRTFVHNGRRYGQPNNIYGKNWKAGDPRIQGQDEHFFYDEHGNSEPIVPGILGGWRPDLQGKVREQTRQRKNTIMAKSRHGDIQGFKVYLFDTPSPDLNYRPGREFFETERGDTHVFLGIPYAEPPVGEGRFKPPRWHRGWQLLQAVDFGPACPQPLKYTGHANGVRDVDEDCLYLNIYAPPVEGVAQKYPVMVYIHGGDFIRGSSNSFTGHILATFFNVVVVTFNYRLGALGFLSTADENSPGNYGILDQAMALRWIHENIENFNGDPNSITLFGPGAGAASAGLLMVAPQTRDIVTKVIAQSGSAVADWAMIFDKYRAQNTSRVFGKLIGCSIESSWKLVDCLKQGRTFVDLGNVEFPPEVGLFPWAPVIEMNVTMPYYEGWNEQDWHFISESPEQLVRKGRFNRGLKYMSSVTLQEAASFVTSNSSLRPDYIINEEFFDQKVRELVLRYNYTLNPNGTYEAIKYMYTYWPDPTNVTHIREKYIQMLTDFLYTAPNDKMVKLLLEKDVPVYMYVLNTTVDSFKYPEWAKVPHDIEHYLLCGAPFMDVEFYPSNLNFYREQWTNNDRNMSYFFMRAYTDFARYGNPSYTQILGLHFEEARYGQLKYLNLNTTYNSSIKWNYRQTESAFWTNYIPTVVGYLMPTYPPTTEFWFEPQAPLQIAFWSMSATCLLLVVLLVVCCMLWRNAKKQSDRFYKDIYMVSDTDNEDGIDNTPHNIYEYQEKMKNLPARTSSAASFRTTESAISLKESQGFMNNSESARKGTPVMTSKNRNRQQLPPEIPQTDV